MAEASRAARSETSTGRTLTRAEEAWVERCRARSRDMTIRGGNCFVLRKS